MSKTVYQRLALGNYLDLTVPTATAEYTLGVEVEMLVSGETAKKVYKYVKAGSALTAKGAYVIANTGTPGAEVTTAAPATTAVPVQGCVANVAFTSGYYGFVQIEGDTTVVSTGATTKLNTATLANGVTTVTDEAGTTETALTVGIFKDTLGATGDATLYLLGNGKKVTIA